MIRKDMAFTPRWWIARFMQLARGTDQLVWKRRYVRSAREWNHIAIRERARLKRA